MPTPSGISITPSVQTATYTPTTIRPDAPNTEMLLSTYLFPLLSGLGITPPSGTEPVGFNFSVFPNGTSIATVRWAATGN